MESVVVALVCVAEVFLLVVCSLLYWLWFRLWFL